MIVSIIGLVLGFILALGGTSKRAALLGGYWLAGGIVLVYMLGLLFLALMTARNTQFGIVDGLRELLDGLGLSPVEEALLVLSPVLQVVLAVFLPRLGYLVHDVLLGSKTQ